MALTRTEWSIAWFGLAILAFVAVPPIWFLYAVGGAPWSEGKLAALGDFLGGSIGSVLGLFNLIAVAYIGYAVSTFQRSDDAKQEQLKAAADLHREWSSPTMYQSRRAAQTFVMAHPDGGLDALEKLYADKMNDVFVVIGFFDRLSVQVQESLVSPVVASKVFGQLFVWWDILLMQRLPDKWDSQKHIARLRDGLANTDVTESLVWQRWQSQASVDQEQYKAAVRSPVSGGPIGAAAVSARPTS